MRESNNVRMGTHYDGCWRDHKECAVARCERLEAELVERKAMAGVTGRKLRDLRAELASARQWAGAWKDAAKRYRGYCGELLHGEEMAMDVAKERNAEIERLEHDLAISTAQDHDNRVTIGRLVWILDYALKWVRIAPLYAKVCTVVMDELGLTWADAIEEAE